jgi:Mn-dependent DtxR family transcriptional regulator
MAHVNVVKVSRRWFEVLPQVLEVVEKSELPTTVSDIAKRLDLSWSTARQALMELSLDGVITAVDTSRGKLYNKKRKESTETVETRRETLSEVRS